MGLLVWTAGCVVAAGAALMLMRRSFAVVLVSGISMEPAFHAGDLLLVRRRRPSRLRVGDVVVFERPPGWPADGEPSPERRWMVKRVAALPGDPVPDQVAAAVTGHRVGPGRLVVLGDNPVPGFDSRQFGFVSADRLLGVVLRRME